VVWDNVGRCPIGIKHLKEGDTFKEFGVRGNATQLLVVQQVNIEL
jgi:hypothetical protein